MLGIAFLLFAIIISLLGIGFKITMLKRILIVIAVALGVSFNGVAQSEWKDSATKTTVNWVPATMDGVLFEIITVYKGARAIQNWFKKIETCEQYFRFKKDYPIFYISDENITKFQRKCL